jgi:hypothetical protein
MSNPASPSVPRSANSREPRRRAAPRLAIVALLAFGDACSRGAHATRLPALTAGDEIYRISCKDSIQACRDEAAEVCAGRYDVLEANGAPVEPPRVTSAPGPASTGPRYQRLKWVGQMVVACGGGRAADATQTTSPPTAATPNAPDHGATTAAPDRLCIPGVTQECLGPGACRGAQACSTDGNGYGPCDCGNPAGSGGGKPATRAGGDAGASTPSSPRR